ncbi:MAG TPA: response regulator [Pyrinomonadaceae bacterium]|nr:response regulator [Pyrinomonadaceae bacterium]
MNPHRKRVLCVEDEEDTCSMITSLLGLIDCQVVSAQTFDEARQKIREERFDLYLLDNWLPGGTGLDLCREIREGDTKTPIIFYSGAAYDSDRQAAREAGAQAYLVKPTDISRMIETVKIFLH